MEWRDLFTALALVLVIEGIMPFTNPQSLRRMFSMVSELSDQQLRTYGGVLMVVGLVSLYFIR